MERLVSDVIVRGTEPLVLAEDSHLYKLSSGGQFVSASLPDQNVDGSFPSDQIDPYVMGITLERKVDRSLSHLEVCDRDFLKIVRQKRV